MYTNKDVSARFGISRESVRLWSVLFADHLSPSATPEKGKQRNYTDDDLSVFSLVESMRRGGAANEDIAAALGAGQRGPVPGSALAPRADSSAAALKRQVNHLTVELENTQQALQRAEGRIEQLEKDKSEYQAEIRRLNREIGRLEAAHDDE